MAALVVVLAAFEPLLGCSWPLLGRSWLVLGRSWLVVGRSWGGLRLVLGWSWALLGRSWPLLAGPWGTKIDFPAVLVANIEFSKHIEKHEEKQRFVEILASSGSLLSPPPPLPALE